MCSPFNHLLISHPNPGRLRFSFGWERTVMATLTTKTCYARLIGRLTYLNQKPRASSLACGCSTMHRAIKSGLKMVCLLKKCPRTPTKAGLMSRMVQQCGEPRSWFSIHPFYIPKLSTNPYITQMTTRQCPSGSKGWQTS